MKFKSYIYLVSILLLTSCATTNSYEIEGVTAPEGNYNQVLDHWSSDAKVYSGVVSSFQVAATLLAPDVIHQQSYLEAKKIHRTAEQYTTADQAVMDETKNSTTFFVALYTDKDSNNDLDKQKSFWNVFLDVGGKRFTPKIVKRVFDNRIGLNDKYPYLNSWSRPYTIVFPLPLSQTLEQQVTLTVASPLGAAYLKFPK